MAKNVSKTTTFNGEAFKPSTASDFIDAMAARDPFFKGDKDMIANSFRFNVWNAGPYIVVLPNAPFKDLDRNMKIAQMMQDCRGEAPPSMVCSGLLGDKDDMDNARTQYAFSNPAAAAWFARKVETEFGLETAAFEMTDAGPNRMRIEYHSAPAERPRR